MIPARVDSGEGLYIFVLGQKVRTAHSGTRGWQWEFAGCSVNCGLPFQAGTAPGVGWNRREVLFR